MPGVRLGRPTGGGIEPLALPFDERIEAVGVQQGVHSTIERMGDRLGQVGRGDPEGFLSSACASGAHGHANECTDDDRFWRSI